MALNNKYIKIERILESVYRDFGFNTSIDWVDVIEWIGECLTLIGSSRIFMEKITDGNTDLYHPCAIEISNYRGTLPFDVYEIIQARWWESENVWGTMRRATDTFHNSYFCNNSPDHSSHSEHTYKVNNNYIFTSFETGKVQLSYRALPSDERGYPLIPDNQKFIEACKWFIADKIAFRLSIQGKIERGIAERINQEKLWYIGAADTAARLPDYDEVENWKNQLIRLIPDVAAHGNAFAGIGEMERRFNSNNDR